MTMVFLLQDQNKRLLDKRGEWVDGRDAASLFRTAHRDEALNQMVEVNARDYTLRIHLLECPVSERGLPLVQPCDLPPLMAAASDAANDAGDAPAQLDDGARQG